MALDEVPWPYHDLVLMFHIKHSQIANKYIYGLLKQHPSNPQDAINKLDSISSIHLGFHEVVAKGKFYTRLDLTPSDIDVESDEQRIYGV